MLLGIKNELVSQHDKFDEVRLLRKVRDRIKRKKERLWNLLQKSIEFVHISFCSAVTQRTKCSCRKFDLVKTLKVFVCLSQSHVIDLFHNL